MHAFQKYAVQKYACMQSKYAHLGLSNDVPMGKKCSPHLGLSNDVFWFWGCPTMFRWEKNDVPHIWVCPTMLRRKKTMFFAFGAVQRCFDGKKTMFPTFGAVQRCFAEKKRCSAHLGLSNDVFCFWAVQRCFAEKKRCPVQVGRALRRPLKKSDGGSAGRSESRTGAPAAAHKMDVQHIWAWQNQCLVRGGFPRGGNLGRGKSLKTNIPY